MPDQDQEDTSLGGDADATRRSEEVGIAEETAAYAKSAKKDAPPSIHDGDPRTKDDGSGTSETD